MSRSGRARFWRDMGLRSRLVVTVAVVIALIQVGEVLRVLSREVADLDYRVAIKGTILAQSAAAACAPMLDGENPNRFDEIRDRLAANVDLVDMAIIDNEGRIVGHRDPARVGTLAPKGSFGTFHPPRRSPGLHGLFRRYTEYTAAAPILLGTEVKGFVTVGYRSREVPDRATGLILSAAGMAGVWVLVGGLAASLYVRRITRPLAALSRAATDFGEGRADEPVLEEPTSGDEVGRLQRSFKRLLEALRGQRAENARLLAEQRELNLRLRGRVDDMTVDLSRKTAYLEAVLDSMEEGVITCDADGRIVQANPGAERQLQGLGRPKPGRSLTDLVPDGQKLRAAVNDAIGSGNRAVVELVVGEAGGVESERRTVVFRAYPLHGGDGAALGALVIVNDETRERVARQQLRRHDRLISLGTLAAGLAHELGNYMHTIHGFAALLANGLAEGSPSRRDAEAIRRDSAQSIALLDRFLLFARPGSVQIRPEPLDALLREGLDLCSYPLRRAEVALVFHGGVPGLVVACDRRLFSQVIVNLVLNAIDAMRGRPTPRIEISAREQGRWVDIAVSDNGCGIAPDHVERIFDPFFTTKEAEGTGLGLAIANQIVELHQGRLTVQSQPGHGATFHVLLPMDRDDRRDLA